VSGGGSDAVEIQLLPQSFHTLLGTTSFRKSFAGSPFPLFGKEGIMMEVHSVSRVISEGLSNGLWFC